MADRLNNFAFSFTLRPAPENGPTSSDAWNDTFEELAVDLANISIEWNTKLTKIIEGLPSGSLDTQVNAFRNGLDGKNMWVDRLITSSSEDLTYFNSIRNRPNTLKEQFDAVYAFINTQIDQVESTVVEETGALTVDQKNRIGANIFDNTQISASNSLDGKSENSRLNIIQLANDLYGSTAQLNNNGVGILTIANIFDMLGQLMTLHNSGWNTGVAPTHTGSFSVTQNDVNSSAPGNDAFVGSPSDLEEDLDQIRTTIRNLKGTASWLSALSSLYGGGTNTLQGLLTSTQGSGTKTSSNPWGYRFDNVDGLVTRLDAIRDFTGQDSHTDTTPDYSSSLIIGLNDSLETAIGKLDLAVATQSGVIIPQLAALELFTGQDNDTDSTPDYTSTTFISNGDSLETAIGKLDFQLSTISGQISGGVAQLAALETFVGQDNDVDSTPDYSSTSIVSNGDSLETAIGKIDLFLDTANLASDIIIDPVLRTSSFFADYRTLHRINPLVSGMNIVMPAASGLSGALVIIKVQSNSNDTFNIVASGIDTIDGQLIQLAGGARISLSFISDGISDWLAI